MTYFLIKHYDLVDGKLQKSTYGHIMVRPCKDDYETVLAILKCTHPTRNVLDLEGQCAMFNERNGFAGRLDKKFNNIEEWTIWLNLEKGIFFDFEEICVCCPERRLFNDYTMKVTDLHTKEVVFDETEKTISHLMKLKS